MEQWDSWTNASRILQKCTEWKAKDADDGFVSCLPILGLITRISLSQLILGSIVTSAVDMCKILGKQLY